MQLLLLDDVSQLSVASDNFNRRDCKILRAAENGAAEEIRVHILSLSHRFSCVAPLYGNDYSINTIIVYESIK